MTAVPLPTLAVRLLMTAVRLLATAVPLRVTAFYSHSRRRIFTVDFPAPILEPKVKNKNRAKVFLR